MQERPLHEEREIEQISCAISVFTLFWLDFLFPGLNSNISWILILECFCILMFYSCLFMHCPFTVDFDLELENSENNGRNGGFKCGV